MDTEDTSSLSFRFKKLSKSVSLSLTVPEEDDEAKSNHSALRR